MGRWRCLLAVEANSLSQFSITGSFAKVAHLGLGITKSSRQKEVDVQSLIIQLCGDDVYLLYVYEFRVGDFLAVVGCLHLPIV